MGHHSKPFQDYAAALETKLALLLACAPLSESDLRDFDEVPGIYLFSEGDRHLYAGRTNNLKSRIQTHRRAGSKRNQAAFAYALAKAELGVAAVPYTKRHPEHPENLNGFEAAFCRAKDRVRSMRVRVVREDDPIGQALLEIYVHLRLATPFNNFDNH